jgi:hypothetical protein
MACIPQTTIDLFKARIQIAYHFQIPKKQSSLNPKIETQPTVIGSVVVRRKHRQLIQHHQLTPIRSHRRIDTGFKKVRFTADQNWLLNLRKMPLRKSCRAFLTPPDVKNSQETIRVEGAEVCREVDSPSQRLVHALSTGILEMSTRRAM